MKSYTRPDIVNLQPHEDSIGFISASSCRIRFGTELYCFVRTRPQLQPRMSRENMCRYQPSHQRYLLTYLRPAGPGSMTLRTSHEIFFPVEALFFVISVCLPVSLYF
ncbi:hypothetical protein ABW21_db0202755 [Orbilia brochopaga]|nr:hypothetical protein ABW21_db0202755 [Drechslerella brochopaga]